MSNTKERPIVLTAQEVNAVLAGDKTQHRMPIKLRYGSPEFLGSRDCNKSDPSLWGWDNFEDSETRVLSSEPCPFGVVSDRLWVQEDHARYNMEEGRISLCAPHYFADGPLTLDLRHDAGLLNRFSAKSMYRSISRLLLEITDIRIERVRDIDAASAEVEGCFNFSGYERLKPRPLSAFITYWMAKHGDDAWFTNPWVWVIEFKVVEPSEVQGG